MIGLEVLVLLEDRYGEPDQVLVFVGQYWEVVVPQILWCYLGFDRILFLYQPERRQGSVVLVLLELPLEGLLVAQVELVHVLGLF
jgi:hypothetical protein